MFQNPSIILFLMVFFSFGALAQEPTKPTTQCHSDYVDRWTKQEDIVWQHVIKGEEVDLGAQDELDADSCRILRSTFLQTILLDPKFRSQITRHGIRIAGARFVDKVDLVNANLEFELWITNSTFEQDVDLSGLRSTHLIDLQGTTGRQDFDLSGAQLAGDLLLGNKAHWNDVELDSANIQGHLNFDHSVIGGKLSMEGIRVGGNFIADTSQFNEITIEGGHINGTLSLRSSTVEKELNMDGLQIGGTFVLRDLTGPKSVTMSGLTFSTANWGPDPTAILTNLTNAAGEAGLSPQLYTKLAKSYLDAGQPDLARKISIQKEDADFNHTKSAWTKSWLYFFWFVAGYGYRLENTLMLIAGFVLVGAVAFKTGTNKIVAGKRPDNWFVFSLDSVIPGIHLKKDHDDIAFSGWRQFLLYFLRFLGAVVLVIMLELLKRTVVDSG